MLMLNESKQFPFINIDLLQLPNGHYDYYQDVIIISSKVKKPIKYPFTHPYTSTVG